MVSAHKMIIALRQRMCNKPCNNVGARLTGSNFHYSVNRREACYCQLKSNSLYNKYRY